MVFSQRKLVGDRIDITLKCDDEMSKELGVAFHQAHGCRLAGKNRNPKAQQAHFDGDNQSMQTWRMYVQDTVAVLETPPVKERY